MRGAFGEMMENSDLYHLNVARNRAHRSQSGGDVRVMLADLFHAMVAQIVDSTPGAHHGYGHPRGLSALSVHHI